MKAFARKHAVVLLMGLALGAGLIGCAPEESPPPPAQRAAADTRFALNVGGRALRAELAVSELERAKGLMYRTALPEDCGMLFVFATPSRQSFWMKNTEIPLDLGYFDRAGVLQEVKPLYPHDLTGVNSSSAEIALCLEMPQGWFARNAVHAGAQLDMEQVKAALKARGFIPGDYGL